MPKNPKKLICSLMSFVEILWMCFRGKFWSRDSDSENCVRCKCWSSQHFVLSSETVSTSLHLLARPCRFGQQRMKSEMWWRLREKKDISTTETCRRKLKPMQAVRPKMCLRKNMKFCNSKTKIHCWCDPKVSEGAFLRQDCQLLFVGVSKTPFLFFVTKRVKNADSWVSDLHNLLRKWATHKFKNSIDWCMIMIWLPTGGSAMTVQAATTAAAAVPTHFWELFNDKCSKRWTRQTFIWENSKTIWFVQSNISRQSLSWLCQEVTRQKEEKNRLCMLLFEESSNVFLIAFLLWHDVVLSTHKMTKTCFNLLGCNPLVCVHFC